MKKTTNIELSQENYQAMRERHEVIGSVELNKVFYSSSKDWPELCHHREVNFCPWKQ